MSYNNISASIADPDHATLIATINDVKNHLPFLVNLTPKERQAGTKGQNKLTFVMASFDYATNNPNIVPSTLNLAEWASDIELLQKITTLLQVVNVLQEGLKDTQLALRKETTTAALNFYKYAKVAATGQVPGIDVIVDDLKKKLE
jgi:hypothetical protein